MLDKNDVFTHFPIYSPWRTVSQLWHFKHHTCHCRSRATKAWPSRNWFPQPAQAPGSEGPSPDPLVAELFPIGVEASRTGIPTHRWQRAWPIDNALLVEIEQIRSAYPPHCLLFEKRTINPVSWRLIRLSRNARYQRLVEKEKRSRSSIRCFLFAYK